MRVIAMGVGLLLALWAVGKEPSHWVVGSFSSSINARAEAERLQGELGVPVAVTSSSPHRLLVDHDALAPETLRSRTRAAGVSNPWPLYDDVGNESPAVANEPVWLKIADVSDIQISIDIELELARLFSGVRSDSVMTNGTLSHRVILGPVPLVDLERVRARLREAGYQDVERILRPPDVDAGQVVRIRGTAIPSPAESRRGDISAAASRRHQPEKRPVPGRLQLRDIAPVRRACRGSLAVHSGAVIA
ncbi:MAG: hypothetical protein U5O39_15600 [Gammaproteobacteria bacterium]|nr:hypothetical protein [Gammaproteobacteria bacterium]